MSIDIEQQILYFTFQQINGNQNGMAYIIRDVSFYSSADAQLVNEIAHDNTSNKAKEIKWTSDA